MAVYLANIALIIFWRMYFTQKRFSNARKYFCIVAALQWILISGLRHWDVGADTYNYYSMFEDIKLTSWGAIFRDFVRLQNDNEIGYDLLTKVFQVFSGSYQLFLIVIAVFFMWSMAVWIYRNSASPCTSFLLFSTLFYSFYAITGHRQAIATALVVFLGYDLIQKRKFWKFAAVSFAAFLIHKSSLVFVPLYFLAAVPATVGYMFLCASAITAVAVLGKRLYGPIALWAGYSERQINYTEGGAELYAVLLVLLCIVIWILFPRIRKHRDDADLLFHVNSLALASGLLVIQNQSFMRIQQYYSLFLMITVPEVINTVKREYRLLVYLLFGTVMILYLIRNNPAYLFFFMK